VVPITADSRSDCAGNLERMTGKPKVKLHRAGRPKVNFEETASIYLPEARFSG
jgi:hypothetical protein